MPDPTIPTPTTLAELQALLVMLPPAMPRAVILADMDIDTRIAHLPQ
jgi:hypothetical protein